MFVLDRYQRFKDCAAYTGEDIVEKLEWDNDTARPIINTKPLFGEKGCVYLPPRVVLIKYTEKDWIYDFCKSVEEIINSDPETN